MFLGSLTLSGQQHFPDQWSGKWEGMMYLQKEGISHDSVLMTMTIAPTEETEVWTWKTEYQSPETPIVKDYVLKVVNAKTKEYVIDELNGIVLPSYLFGNKLYSVFDVQGSLLTCSYELIEEQLIFEVTSGKRLEGEQEGVGTYTVSNLQRAILRRKKE